MFTKILRTINRLSSSNITPYDFSKDELRIIKYVEPYTMTSKERIISLIRAINYISKTKVKGDIVECGVWKGGSMMAAAMTLSKLKDTRRLWLYDTFEGMTMPDRNDVSSYNNSALKEWDKNKAWCYSSLDEVRKNISMTLYPKQFIKFVQGKVEDTIPTNVPEEISILRLDTDWYKSTKHELQHLFPRITKGGIIIIDDYGYWKGAKKAVDEYIKKNNINIFLSRIDETGRIGVKT